MDETDIIMGMIEPNPWGPEPQPDPAYEAWILEQERQCRAYVIFGNGGSDPYEAQCLKDHKHHEDADNNDMHVGRDPFQSGPFDETNPTIYVRWQGSDTTIAGDYHKGASNIEFQQDALGFPFDEAAYRESVAAQYTKKEKDNK